MAESARVLSAQDHAESLNEYIDAGVQRAGTLGNRGPIRFDVHGKLHPDILDAYWRTGFYVFEGIIDRREIDELRLDAEYLIDHAPAGTGTNLDSKGRPAIADEFTRPSFTFIEPLSDPWGGTELLSGRHPTQMAQPRPADDAPDEVLFLIHGMCQIMPSGLRLYGHPDLLAIAEGVNGADFTPYNDILFVKPPGLGGSVSWHQDGVTHWDSPQWDEGIHGFNFQVQLYECTPRNCLWVMPGTHKQGRIDIKRLVEENGGSERIPGAVPLLCQPGDATIVNRQALHCSFANTSPNLRVSCTFGFHRRSSVLGAHGALSQSGQEVYDEDRIFERSRVIALAIDARGQHYPDEPRFDYQPFRGLQDKYRYNEETVETVLRDYNLQDLSI
jgi:hypothetical protein